LYSSRTVTYLLAMSKTALREYLLDNGVDVAQLFALLNDFSNNMKLEHTDVDLWEKHLVRDGIKCFLGEIDPKK
jgi:hypothetical protein